MKKLFSLSLLGIIAACNAISQSTYPLIRTNLYVLGKSGDTTMLDGDLTQYDPSFSNAVDGNDARKMNNGSENIGMIRANTTLVIERRHTIEMTDSIFYKIWNLNRGRKYQLQFEASKLTRPGLTAYLEDLYLNTKTQVALQGMSHANFDVASSDPAAISPFRFRLVFVTELPPVSFASVQGWLQNKGVTIDWKVSNENKITHYTIEHSFDGKAFSSIADIQAKNLPASDYTYEDTHPEAGYNYYRIRSAGATSDAPVSTTIKVFAATGFSEVKIFPNPVTGNVIHLQMLDKPAGLYKIRLLNNFGQSFMATTLNHVAGAIEHINLSKTLSHGMYQLEVTLPDGSKTIRQVVL